MRDGRPAFVTCVAATNLAEAWREHRRDGGIVIDVASGETVASGLSMPHSPRLHRGRLWLVQSGTGEFGHVDLATGRFEPVCFLQGFARGVAFVGEHAVIGVSRPRENRTFEGLALNERLAREGVGPLCHLAVVNLATGDVEHRLVIEGVVEELYDVAVLPGVIRPMAIGFRTDEIRFLVRPAQLSRSAANESLSDSNQIACARLLGRRKRDTRTLHARDVIVDSCWRRVSRGTRPMALNLSQLDGTNGFRLDGIDADDGSGFSVAGAGDVNGDGIDDLIVGARRRSGGRTDAGESYVVFGTAAGFAASLDLAALDGTTASASTGSTRTTAAAARSRARATSTATASTT